MVSITVAEYFPAHVRQKISNEDWEACLDAWILICHRLLILSQKEFTTQASDSPSLLTFITSYIVENVSGSRCTDFKSKSLRRKVFLLVHRLLSEQNPVPSNFLTFDFLSDLSAVYHTIPSLSGLLSRTWENASLSENLSFKKHKVALIQSLETSNTTNGKKAHVDILVQAAALLKSCFQYGQYLLAGSDLLDALNSACPGAKDDLRKKLMVIAYRSLLSLVKPERPRVSTLIDHLYSLKSSPSPLLQNLCSETPLLRQMRTAVTGPEAARADTLMQQLTKWEKPVRRKIRKDKGKESDGYTNETPDHVHVHQMSLITQVQDIFPDLGTAFVAKLLAEYENNVEQVTQHLLEDSLPGHLKDQDRSENLSVLHSNLLPLNAKLLLHRPPGRRDKPPRPADHLAPRSTPPLPPTRRNIFDDDDFSKLEISPSQLHYGRASDHEKDADTLLKERTPESVAASKAAILSALAAFDADDDERDDTYDVEDVGGTVDVTMPGSSGDVLKGEDKKDEVREEALFRAFNASPEIFGRDLATRKSQPRLTLREETGMTDEMIEGWAIMLRRDPGRLRRLEAKFSIASVDQRELGRSSWQETEEDTEDHIQTPPRFTSRGRGGYRNYGRRGRGNVAGLANDRSTQQARQNKDQNKGSRANHNRRDQRAKKMARGGFPG